MAYVKIKEMWGESERTRDKVIVNVISMAIIVANVLAITALIVYATIVAIWGEPERKAWHYDIVTVITMAITGGNFLAVWL